MRMYTVCCIVYRPTCTLHIILCLYSLEFIIQILTQKMKLQKKEVNEELKFCSMKMRSSNIVSSTIIMHKFILVSSQELQFTSK